MRVDLAFGKHGLTIEAPDDADIVEPAFVPGVPDEPTPCARHCGHQSVASAPGRSARPTDSVVIVHSDLTRPAPNDRMLPVVLDELAGAGVPDDHITLLNATGLHRPNTDAELRQMLGNALVDRYRCENHDAHDHASLRHVGATPGGAEVWLNRWYVDASLRITTGFIEPHFFAGFSGGAKSVLPGVAGDMSVCTTTARR